MAPLFEPSAPRHRPGVRTDDRAHAFARDHREVPRRRSSSPRRSTRPSRGNPSWRQRHSTPRSDHCTRREAWSSERDHGERHFGARNPLLRGSGPSASSLPGARFFTQVLHLRDRERRGREVSAVFANESFTGSAGGDRWLSRHCSKGQPARARWWATQLARGESLESPGTQAVVRRANAFTKTRRRRRSQPSPQGSGRSQRGCTVERSCSRIRVHARCTRRQGTWLTWQGRPLPPEPPLDRARERRPMQVGEDSSAEGARNRRSHVDRGVTRLDPEREMSGPTWFAPRWHGHHALRSNDRGDSIEARASRPFVLL